MMSNGKGSSERQKLLLIVWVILKLLKESYRQFDPVSITYLTIEIVGKAGYLSNSSVCGWRFLSLLGYCRRHHGMRFGY
ncbi:MAG: hypothetical protein GPOALKHO_000440 [Sodalis sp.]|nr:MAG: hypothetical protein GPOALKHO_000440 [Sodalis sp.]